MQVVAVTGINNGVGRTTMAINLAVYNSMYNKKKTMLIDFNQGQDKLALNFSGSRLVKGLDDLINLIGSDYLDKKTFSYSYNRITEQLIYVSAPTCFELEEYMFEKIKHYAKDLGVETLIIDGCMREKASANICLDMSDSIVLLSSDYGSMRKDLEASKYLACLGKTYIAVNDIAGVGNEVDAVDYRECINFLKETGYKKDIFYLPYDKRLISLDKSNGLSGYMVENQDSSHGRALVGLSRNIL